MGKCFGRKLSWPNGSYILAFTWMDWGRLHKSEAMLPVYRQRFERGTPLIQVCMLRLRQLARLIVSTRRGVCLNLDTRKDAESPEFRDRAVVGCQKNEINAIWYWLCHSCVWCPNTGRFLVKLRLNFCSITESNVYTICNENVFYSRTLGLN
jgi:hypothetical protein